MEQTHAKNDEELINLTLPFFTKAIMYLMFLQFCYFGGKPWKNNLLCVDPGALRCWMTQ